MSDPRRFRVALASARVVAGTAVAAGFALAVATLVAVPLPGHTATPVAVEAAPTPSESVAVCAGPVLAAGRSSADAAALGTAASQRLVAVTGSGEDAASVVLTGPVADEGPTAFVAAPAGDSAVEVAAAGSAGVESDDIRGFAAAACRPALFDSWLVAGAATTGAADLVLLANPGEVTATVTLTVYGVDGATTAPGGTDVVVPAASQVVVPLAGLRLGEATPVVRVTASGAPVAATLQSSVTRTLVPGGVDQSSAVATPTTEVVIPGVAVLTDRPVQSDPTVTLRVLAPGSDGTATVSLTRADGGAAPADQSVPLTAGHPVQVDLGALTAGTWTATVTSDAPVVAAVWQTTGFGEGADFAWYSAAPAIDRPTLVAVADGPSPLLVLANTADAPASVTVVDDGAGTEVTVPGRGTASLAVSAGAVLSLDPGAAVHAAVTYADAGALAGYPVWPGDAAAPPITVYP